MSNNYIKDSELYIETYVKDSKTIIKDSFFTSPFKIISPFYDNEDNIMRLCVMNISPGMLEGDFYKQDFILNENSRLHIFSQSYGKVFSMKDGFAEQKLKVILKDKSRLEYFPLPTIPYTGSSYKSTSEFHMTADSSLIYREILSCGRYKMGERFEFKEFSSLVKVYYNSTLVLWDNTVLSPSCQPIEGMGFYEGFSHAANLFIIDSRVSEIFRNRINEILSSYEEISYGISLPSDKCIIVRILGNNSDYLCKITDELLFISRKA